MTNELLNKKKIHIKWKFILKILFICIIISTIFLWAKGYRVRYMYYLKQNKQYIDMGISANSNLYNIAVTETVMDYRNQGYEIAYYTDDAKVSKMFTIVKKDTFDDEAEIKSIISNHISIYVYALELELDGKIYYLPGKRGYRILDRLKEKNPNLKQDLLKGVFIEVEKVLDSDQINELIATYKS